MAPVTSPPHTQFLSLNVDWICDLLPANTVRQRKRCATSRLGCMKSMVHIWRTPAPSVWGSYHVVDASWRDPHGKELRAGPLAVRKLSVELGATTTRNRILPRITWVSLNVAPLYLAPKRDHMSSRPWPVTSEKTLKHLLSQFSSASLLTHRAMR